MGPWRRAAVWEKATSSVHQHGPVDMRVCSPEHPLHIHSALWREDSPGFGERSIVKLGQNKRFTLVKLKRVGY